MWKMKIENFQCKKLKRRRVNYEYGGKNCYIKCLKCGILLWLIRVSIISIKRRESKDSLGSIGVIFKNGGLDFVLK